MFIRGQLLCITTAPFILNAMNINSDISHLVLDRLKRSPEHIEEAIKQPGIDRCFKGSPLEQLSSSSKSAVNPGVGIEDIEKPDKISQQKPAYHASVEPEAVPRQEAYLQDLPQTVARNTVRHSDEELELLEGEWKKMVEAVQQLQDESQKTATTINEVRVEMGKVAAYSRREVVSFGKRLDLLEQTLQQMGSQDPVERSAVVWSEEPYLQQMNQQVDVLNHSMEQIQQQFLKQNEGKGIGAGEVEQRLQQLFQQVSAVETQSVEQQKRSEELLQQQPSGVLVEQLQQRLVVLESGLEQKVDEEGVAVGFDSSVFEKQILRLTQSVDELQQQQHSGVQREVGEHSQLEHQLSALSEVVASLDEQIQQHQNNDPIESPLNTADGREKNIVQELRYEIGEVRKSSNRQLEALSNKLHTLSTSSEVNQIVKHATAQLRQRIDGAGEQMERGVKKEAAIPVVRF